MEILVFWIVAIAVLYIIHDEWDRAQRRTRNEVAQRMGYDSYWAMLSRDDDEPLQEEEDDDQRF